MTGIREVVLAALHEVLDPELGINVVDLGLIYRVEAQDGDVHIVMTMTSPACPLRAYLTTAVETQVRQRVPGVRSVRIDMVREPPWQPEMMSQAAPPWGTRLRRGFAQKMPRCLISRKAAGSSVTR